MRNVLFGIGCVLFICGLIFWVVMPFTSIAKGEINWLNDKVKDNLNMFHYWNTVLFFVGTYLISNNKPEKKD